MVPDKHDYNFLPHCGVIKIQLKCVTTMGSLKQINGTKWTETIKWDGINRWHHT